MSDKAYPVLKNFERVDTWNTNSDIYRHGNVHQQSLKMYRHLGDLCEGVQKMKQLDVASAMGKFVVALVGVASFAGVDAEELDELYSYAGRKATACTPAQAACNLVRSTTSMVNDINQWLSPAGTQMARAIATSSICEVFCLLKQNASLNAVVLDRTIENATNCLLKKTGKMDEFGIFHPEAAEPTRFGGEVTARGEALWAKQFILNGLKGRFAELTVRFQFEVVGDDISEVIEQDMNVKLKELLEKHVLRKPEYRHLMNDRKPAIVAVKNHDQLEVLPNDDLKELLNELEKVTG
ncbi:hypothetical protein HUXLEY_240 [Erwinia phage vB_EamM_Huxley]|uniref:Uncharacterized protein n=1 Tax=Erwinia phage vB_EamM_Huxley TaxID=1883373 RepID=A0A1B2IDK5_9CAUD|nr:hypothetical protein BIZ81_gp043 [Erwinia phage vB_EamM_Huxley]ANZ49322.1 hypothetical protein HUXLEY_240 [Erwinia phage vB_EamM_Huxley]